MFRIIEYRELLATGERVHEKIKTTCGTMREAELLARHYRYLAAMFATANRYEIREG